MPDTPLHDVLARIERLLLEPEANTTLDWWTLGVRFHHDSGHIFMKVFQTADEARRAFATHGNRFQPPFHSVRVADADGTVIQDPPQVPPPPIDSTESLPNIGDENFVWRGYGNNQRGVIKMRVGRFHVDLNVPNIDHAARLARGLADVLTG